MTGLKKHSILFALFFLICSFVLAGCNGENAGSPQGGQITKVPAEERKATLLKTLEVKFENPQAHFELGQLYHSEGLWAQAGYHYEVALDFNPVHRGAQAAMVKLLQDSGDGAGAAGRAAAYMKQADGSAKESLKLGRAFEAQQIDDYALACYHQALSLSPDSAEANKRLGFYYLGKGDKESAKGYLIRSFQLNPVQADVAGELGKLGVEVRTSEGTEKPDEPAEEAGKDE